jgi:hypothetical protein
MTPKQLTNEERDRYMRHPSTLILDEKTLSFDGVLYTFTPFTQKEVEDMFHDTLFAVESLDADTNSDRLGALILGGLLGILLLLVVVL